ncbi:unnamed protein product, partial [Ectocarpus sp. 12 AP-2014]
HGGRGEDGGGRPRTEASAAAVAAERLAKGSASEPRVATSSDGRGKQQSRQTVLFKAAAASTGGSGAAAAAAFPAGGGGGLSALPRGGVDDPAPQDIARLGDRRPSGNGLGPAPPSSRGGTRADGFGRKGSSSRRPSIAPGPSSEEREEAAAPQEGGGGREEGELAREAVAAVARAIANGSATAANGAIDEEALLAASIRGEAPTEEVGRGAANTAATPFYTERTRGGGGGGGGGGGDASHKSSRPSRRGSRTNARPTGTDPARRGSHSPPPPADAHEARHSSSSARSGGGSGNVDASAHSRSPPILAELSAVSGPSSRAKPRHRHRGREERGLKRAAAGAAGGGGGGGGSRSSRSHSSSDRKRAISAGGIGPDLR